MMFIFLLERTNKCLVNIKGAPSPFLYNTILMFYFIVALGEREFSWPVISLSLEWLGLLKWQTRVQCDEIKSLIFNKLGLRTKGFFFRAWRHASLTRFNEIIAHFEISSNLWFTLSYFTFKIQLLFCITGTLVSHKLPTDSDPSPSPGCRRGATTIKGYWGGQTAPSAAARHAWWWTAVTTRLTGPIICQSPAKQTRSRWCQFPLSVLSYRVDLVVIERCIGVRREDTKLLDRREEEEEEPGNITQHEGRTIRRQPTSEELTDCDWLS